MVDEYDADHLDPGLIHRAAHAVAAVCFGTPVPLVAAEPNACEDLVFPGQPPDLTDPLTRSTLKAYTVVFLAGPVAERRTKGLDLDAGIDNDADVVRAREIVSWFFPNDESRVVGVMRGEITLTASDFVAVWNDSVRAVAREALLTGSINEERIRELIAPAIDHSRLLAAYHEAGHAAALWLEGNGEVPMAVGLGRSPAESSQNFPLVRPFSPEFYTADVASTPRDRELTTRELERVVAGEEAAKLVDVNYPGAVRARTDREEVYRLARKLTGSQHETQRVEHEARARVRERFGTQDAWALVEALALALLAESALGQEQIREVFMANENRETSRGNE